MACRKRLVPTIEDRSLGQACGDGKKLSLPRLGWRTPFLDIYPRGMSALGPPKTGARTFIDTLLRITKNWKQPKCPSIEEWINILAHLYSGRK